MAHKEAPSIFQPDLRRRRLERAAGKFSEHAFLHERVADDVIDRLETVTRRFENALFFGPAAPLIAQRLTEKADVQSVQIAGESGQFLKALGAANPIEANATAIPVADGALDLLVSAMSLHAENDLPGALKEARRVLKPDGLFIGAFPGERTLGGLRAALRDVETALTGGLSPRVSPFVAIKDAGGLMQGAGFALPVADSFPVTVQYREPLSLLRDLRGMGETAALVKGGKTALRRDVLASALDQLRGQETLFEIVVVTGWVPHPSQQKPLKPGSAKASLADAVLKGL
ncbi:MAG: methyltransferase domain-containing protein [Pseudomonadota bacterium]